MLPLVFDRPCFWQLVIQNCEYSRRSSQTLQILDNALQHRTRVRSLVIMSLTHSLTDSEHLVNLIDATLAYEDTNSRYVEIVTVTVADVDNEGHVVNSLIQI